MRSARSPSPPTSNGDKQPPKPTDCVRGSPPKPTDAVRGSPTAPERPLNFLAHLYLAPTDGPARVGNLMPDLVRRVERHDLPPDVRAGIRQHQQVDRLTDTHPAHHRGRARLRDRHGLFSGVLVDVFFDHVLAAHWADWHEAPLREFVDAGYADLHAHRHLMPEPMPGIVQRMIEQDWLGSYATPAGIAARLEQMSARFGRRFGRTFDVNAAVADLARHRPAFRADLDQLLPMLRHHLQGPIQVSAEPAVPEPRNTGVSSFSV